MCDSRGLDQDDPVLCIFSDLAAPVTEFIGGDPADIFWPDFSLKSRMKLMSLAASTLL